MVPPPGVGSSTILSAVQRGWVNRIALMTTVHTTEELAKALKRGDDSIEIEGNLADSTFRIRATGRLSWFVALGVILLAAKLLNIGSIVAPVAAAVGATAVGAAIVSALGLTAPFALAGLVLAAGGFGVVLKLKKYKQVSRSKGRLLLTRT